MIRTIGSDEAEDVDFVVCASPTATFQGIPGTSIEKCSDCGTDVMVHDSSPKKPPRLCMGCAVIRAQAGDTKH